MANEYATAAALKGALSASSYTGQDTEINQALVAASRQIDAHTGRKHGFWQDATVVTREFFADDPTTCFVEDISTTVGLVVKVDDGDDGTFATTLTITTNFILLPVNAADEVPVEPFTEIRIVDSGASSFPVSSSGRPGVQVTAKFGWPAIPEDVETACIIQAAMLLKGPAAPFGGVELGEAGGVLRLRGSLHPMAEALLEPFCRARAA